LCYNQEAPLLSLNSPLNIAGYDIQWYYYDGIASCPSGTETANWTIISQANEPTLQPMYFLGTRTFACFITPTPSSGLPPSWASGCTTLSYSQLTAQTILGNTNAIPFSLFNYAVIPTLGHYYYWTATNGTITAGQSTNSVSVLWGQTGPYQISLVESNGICSDVSSLLVVNGECTMTVIAVAENNSGICPGSSTLLTAISSTPNVGYQWYFETSLIPGATSFNYEVTSPGSYQVITSLGNCSAASQIIQVTDFPEITLPELSVNIISSECSIESAIVSLEGVAFEEYIWSNGATTPFIELFASGQYSVAVTDSNGCSANAEPIMVNLSLQEPLPLCIVSVDPESNNNIIVWEPLDSEVTSSYAVYKETNVTDNYSLIGIVEYGMDGIFQDVNSNPSIQASKYKLALIDTCGIESSMSALHKTIHLTSNIGLNGTVNLIWSHYEGFYFGSYNIYRGDSPGNLTLLSTIASNLNSYTDITPPDGVYYYVIEVEGISCDPSRDVIVSRSNVVYIAPNSIAQANASILSVYPIPASDELHLALSSDVLGNDVVLTSTTGAIVVQQKITSEKMSLSLDACASGFYILQLRDGNSVVATRRVVVE
jgi:hypothetical protein